MRAPPVAFAVLLACGACGTTAPGPAPAANEAVSDDAQVCGPPPGAYQEGRDPPAYCVRGVRGSLRDTDDRALPGVAVTVCGAACFGAVTDPAGAFRVRVNARLPDGAYALFLHARPRHGSLLLPLPTAPAEELDLGAFRVPVLSDDSATLPPDDGPAAEVQVGPLTLGVQAGTTWELSLQDATDEVEGRVVRFAQVPVERAPEFARGAALVYALAPFDAKPSAPVSLRVRDTGGLAAGTPVDIVVMSGLDLERGGTSGAPTIAATGRVSEDGTTIRTDPGQGISILTWLAIRPSLRP